MKKLIIVMLATLFMLTSCQTAEQDNVPKESETEFNSTQIERTENEIIYNNGTPIDLTNISTIEYYASDGMLLETFEELDSYYRDDSKSFYYAKCILKVTVTDHAESVTQGDDKFDGIPGTYVPCQIESVIYQGESLDLQEGQQIDFRTGYYVYANDGNTRLVISPGTKVLRRGYSYIIYGLLNGKGTFYLLDDDGCFEISSDAEKNAFAENIGLNYSLKSPIQDDVFEKYSNVLTESELAIVKKDNTVVE